MADFPEVLILRHGETEWNRQGRMQGGQDSPLTRRGEGQARAQGLILQRFGVEGFTWVSSPQGRALRTAELARGQAGGIATDARLREISMGDWSGLLREDIARQAPDYFAPEAAMMAWYGNAPGGETLAALAQRLTAFLADLSAPTVIVTHGVTSRALRCLLLGLPVETFNRLEGGQGVVYRVTPEIYERLEQTGKVMQIRPDSGLASAARES